MSVPNYKLIKLNANSLTPTKIYKNLKGKKKFLLESTFQHQTKGKYSFIGENPYQEIIGHKNQTIVLNNRNNTKQEFNVNALIYMKENLPNIQLDIPLPFYGGAVGYVGYDAIREFENIGENLPDDRNMPDIHFMVYENIIVFDHTKKEISLI